MQKFNYSYDKENDDLFLFRPNTSVELGDIILDFNSKKELVGIQIVNASRLFKDITKENLPIIRELLNNLNMCRIDVKPKNNLLLIKIFLFSKVKEITPVLPVPSLPRTCIPLPSRSPGYS